MIKQVGYVLSWVTVLSIALCASRVQANCVCPHMPMGQQDGLYLHYATVHDDNCNHLYATGYVASSPLSNKNCSGTCATSPCFPLGAGSQGEFWFTPAPKKYNEVDDATEFRQYLDYINNGIHLPTYNNSTFELFGTVELTRSAGGPKFYAVIYKVSGSNGSNVAYMGVEISDAGGSRLANLPQFNAVQTNANQQGTLGHFPVPGMLTVDLGNFRYAAVQLNKATNVNSSFAVCHPPTHTPLPHNGVTSIAPPNSFAPALGQGVAPATQTCSCGQAATVVYPVQYCTSRRGRGRRCR